jgi:signal transduction histidine kinase
VLPELSELAGGLPIAASFAMATGITALREGRRRSSLNEAMHELRRPLQGLALSLPDEEPEGGPAEACLRMAVAAIERLDREINGGTLEAPAALASPRPAVEAAIDRWRRPAEALGRSLSLEWKAHAPILQARPPELAQTLDNLISNALVHGSDAVVVEVGEGGERLHIVVRDGGCAEEGRRWQQMLRKVRIGGRDRHGHGLRIVRRVAARCGGSFRLRRSTDGTEARLELPLAGAGR